MYQKYFLQVIGTGSYASSYTGDSKEYRNKKKSMTHLRRLKAHSENDMENISERKGIWGDVNSIILLSKKKNCYFYQHYTSENSGISR